jgi:hypothetical protein
MEGRKEAHTKSRTIRGEKQSKGGRTLEEGRKGGRAEGRKNGTKAE